MCIMDILLIIYTICACVVAGRNCELCTTKSVPGGQYGGDNISVANEAFERFILGQMEEWHVPGLAMAIVEGNKTWSKVVAASP